ncbi:hypothetical protein [Halorussus amylolyticus]|uniref:hypothetical protein n=1 Tax=Halorussus amylolyticus TaxID=1126242 RepID=UPI0010485C75|nr:hypothetical protein [Halorussus amylolyticus]
MSNGSDSGVSEPGVSEPGVYVAGSGRYAVGATRPGLLAVLVAGKALDAVSTVTVLSLRDDVYESMWFTRTMMAELGMVTGVLVTVIVAVAGVALLAESAELLARVLPDSWAPDDYPAAFRVVTYCSAGAWYGFLGMHNFSLLF